MSKGQNQLTSFSLFHRDELNQRGIRSEEGDYFLMIKT